MTTLHSVRRDDPKGTANQTLYGQALVLQEMAQAVLKNVDKFLDAFQGARATPDTSGAMTRQEYFSTFFSVANRFANETSEGMVELLRFSSRTEVVQQTPPSELAKRIRDTAFDSLDRILVRYGQAARKITVIYENIGKIEHELEADASAISAVGAVNSEQSPSDWATEEELKHQHELLLQMQSHAFGNIAQYFRNLESLPEAVLEYSCEKCFPGEVNYELLREQVAEIKPAIQRHLGIALNSLARTNSAGMAEVQQERTRILSNIELQKSQLAMDAIMEKRYEAKLEDGKRFKKLAVCAVGVIAFLGATYVWLMLGTM